MNFRRNYVPGGTYFFTVVMHLRRKIFHNPQAIFILRDSFNYVQKNHPFNVISYVFLPDHIHMIWSLPDGDANYSTRWRLIKSKFSRDYPADFLDVPMIQSKISRGERGIFQRRFWEHTIRDERDLCNHINYIHLNPVKHGYVDDPFLWELSSIRNFAGESELMRNPAAERYYDLKEYDV